MYTTIRKCGKQTDKYSPQEGRHNDTTTNETYATVTDMCMKASRYAEQHASFQASEVDHEAPQPLYETMEAETVLQAVVGGIDVIPSNPHPLITSRR